MIFFILPVNAILGFFGGISYVLGAIIGLAVNLYGLYMLYTALTTTLKGEKKPAKAISYILGLLLILFTIIGLFSRDTVGEHTGFNKQEAEEPIHNKFQDKKDGGSAVFL